MSKESLKKKLLTGWEKSKKLQEQQNKRDKQLKKPQNLIQLRFSRQSMENQHSPSPSARDIMLADLVEIPCEHTNQNQEIPSYFSGCRGK